MESMMIDGISIGDVFFIILILAVIHGIMQWISVIKKNK
jgi:hypothetical protein